ncbi:hypothetical protein Vadar_015201 [Vaccinium darrowii]|uniref:Uncharacterized protein n=1 Tax=Vaccinium darrowii TaxID=229202 RepID=A0ACB7Y0P1_9ERIC|nr:hypothetical protein Vadar_015201 [Vaccinium darrowii]
MAKSTRVACACVFLLVLILCSEVGCVGARHLKHRLCKKCRSGGTRNGLKAAGAAGGKLTGGERLSKMKYVEDFRPTAPGHSPGVGHSITN